MDKRTIIASLQKELEFAHWDIKAETLLALALKKGLTMDDFIVCCDFFLKRTYSKDIFTAEFTEDIKKRNLLKLHLTRMGLYDYLPEGLFFQSSPKKMREADINNLADDYKENKLKEGNIRKFFVPFDNAFFSQRLQLEQEESSLIEGLSVGILNDYFVSFWGLDPSMPKMFMVPLVLLLSYAHKIAGDIELTGRCLSFLLKEKVTMVQKKSVISSAEYAKPAYLGDGLLGMDMVCGHFFYEDSPVIEIKIGPLKNSRMKEYIGGGKRAEVIDTFNRFFIPAGLDVSVSIELAHETMGMAGVKEDTYVEGDMILEKGAEPILGYSTILG